jgi:AraC-like DNA-binding protein
MIKLCSLNRADMSLLKSVALTPAKNLLTDVENRRIYSLKHCELNVFETYRASEQVQLAFNDVVITSMIRGKKIMHLPGVEDFIYLPGETVLAPAGTKMSIDFPDAKEKEPTQCIALTLDGNCISHAIHYLNTNFPRIGSGGWHFNYQQIHLKNSTALADVMNKLVNICSETALTKDILADLTLKELIVRLVQLQAFTTLEETAPATHNNPLLYTIRYINDHLHDRLDIDLLSKKACMSRPSFFRLFKREYGISPVQYIIRERLKKARALLSTSNQSIQQISLEAGFEDANHFIRLFKKNEGTTPGIYRNRLIN